MDSFKGPPNMKRFRLLKYVYAHLHTHTDTYTHIVVFSGIVI